MTMKLLIVYGWLALSVGTMMQVMQIVQTLIVEVGAHQTPGMGLLLSTVGLIALNMPTGGYLK
jgi:predicted anti-sigma-YlaC factor YlaD